MAGDLSDQGNSPGPLQAFDLPRIVPGALAVAIGGCHLDLEFRLRELLRDRDAPISHTLEAFLASLPSEWVNHIKGELLFRDLASCGDHLRDESAARFQLGLRLIAAEVHLLRRQHLLDPLVPLRPYSHPDLAGVEVDEHGLVSVEDFDYLHGAYARCNSVFQPCPSLLSQPNSIYWVDLVLARLRRGAQVRVRLDPLMVAARDGYMGMAYFMASYGRPLDWERISGLKDGEVDHGTWWPNEGLDSEIGRTDYVWARHGDEIEFVCEELPTVGAASHRAARYFHSIFRASDESFIHADGALRFYDPGTQFDGRAAAHVRSAGRIGTRIKLFRVDGQFDLDDMGSLARSFFIWNDEAARYFHAVQADQVIP